MRTTVDIPDSIYRKLKQKAIHEGHSIKELVLRGVQQELRSSSRKEGRRKPPLIDSDAPGSLDLDNAKIFQIIPFP